MADICDDCGFKDVACDMCKKINRQGGWEGYVNNEVEKLKQMYFVQVYNELDKRIQKTLTEGDL